MTKISSFGHNLLKSNLNHSLKMNICDLKIRIFSLLALYSDTLSTFKWVFFLINIFEANMKHTYKLLFLLLVFLVSFGQLKAQETQSHIVVVQTWIMKSPADGSMKEFNSLMDKLFTNVNKKNDKILSQYVTRHFWGSDSRHLVIMTEYASMEAMEESFEMDDKLFEAAFPTEQERKEFNEAFGKYWGYHSDEIYSLMHKK